MDADRLIRDDSIEDVAQKAVFFESFGCQMNLLDSELTLAGLKEQGYRVCARREDADVVIFNTCSVRQHAEDKVWSRLGQLKSLKRKKPELTIGVIGCMAQNAGESIRQRAPHVDLIAGTRHFSSIPELLQRVRSGGQAVTALELDQRMPERRDVNMRPDQFKAFVSVMRGCDLSCTYCIVPRTRGKEISKPVREIREEVARLVGDGVTEVTLLGQTVNSYGKRLDGRPRFCQLLRVLNDVDGLRRLRFITSHPLFMNSELWLAMAECEKVMPYLHLPVQSGSDRVLKAMRRLYTRQTYREIIEEGRFVVPDLEIATDWILGFPGESERDFQDSLALLRDLRFQGSFVFRYSPRAGAPAAEIEDTVPDTVKRERQQIVMKEQQKISAEKYRASIGTELEVLVDGVSRRNPERFAGRDRWFRVVHFPVSEGISAGDYVSVKVLDATALSLLGEVVRGA